LFVAAQAERVPGRIQEDPDIVPRLEAGDPSAKGHGVGDGSVEVLDLDVEVHHRALLAGDGWPDRRYVVLGELEDHVDRVLGGLRMAVPGSWCATGQPSNSE
jgi:hypothetical protein